MSMASVPKCRVAILTMQLSIGVSPGLRRRRIATIEIACQTERSGVNPRTPRPVKSGTRRRGSDSDLSRASETGAPSTSAPGEAFLISCARDCYPKGRDIPTRRGQHVKPGPHRGRVSLPNRKPVCRDHLGPSHLKNSRHCFTCGSTSADFPNRAEIFGPASAGGNSDVSCHSNPRSLRSPLRGSFAARSM
jgi:hypothetical protein